MTHFSCSPLSRFALLSFGPKMTAESCSDAWHGQDNPLYQSCLPFWSFSLWGFERIAFFFSLHLCSMFSFPFSAVSLFPPLCPAIWKVLREMFFSMAETLFLAAAYNGLFFGIGVTEVHASFFFFFLCFPCLMMVGTLASFILARTQ